MLIVVYGIIKSLNFFNQINSSDDIFSVSDSLISRKKFINVIESFVDGNRLLSSINDMITLIFFSKLFLYEYSFLSSVRDCASVSDSSPSFIATVKLITT